MSEAEVLKLARLLGDSPDRFAYLNDVGPDDLRKLREQVTDVLFDADLPVLQRMAMATRVIPAPVLAKIGEKVFGPLLCARIAGLVDVSRGVDVAKRLTPRFLADVAVELDPRRASRIIADIPPSTVAKVAAELVGREDWITVGRFVGHLPDGTVKACLTVIDDPALLEIAYVIDDKSRIDHVVGLLPPVRLESLAENADEDLLENLVEHLSEANLAKLKR
ncbi:hypothetical protein [Amycolatopsis sp. NPDC059657]|uniref:hypothetical protein n=1 Tax=Amycolatopsis sp. NPDC059657 TaxID=3346899 RepID=UPI003672F6E2